jgi:hypothetical protein
VNDEFIISRFVCSYVVSDNDDRRGCLAGMERYAKKFLGCEWEFSFSSIQQLCYHSLHHDSFHPRTLAHFLAPLFPSIFFSLFLSAHFLVNFKLDTVSQNLSVKSAIIPVSAGLARAVLGVVAFLSNTAVASGTMSFFSCSSVIFLSGLGDRGCLGS